MTHAFYAAYLHAWVFWLCAGLGCLGLLLLHHVLRASWGRAVLPVLEAGASTLPVLMLLYVPVLIGGMSALYPWAGAHATDPIAVHRAPYLNMPFFAARFVIFFGVWNLLALLMVRSRRAHGDAVSAAQFRANVAAPGLLVFVLTVTFGMTDWVMSVEPHWSSTIFGVWFITGQALTGITLATLWYTRRASPEQSTLRDLGNLMLAINLFWAYISLSQYLIIWSGNLPEEASFYLRRSQDGWNGLGAVLIVGHFLLPFLALLSGKTKRSARLLGAVAVWLLVMRVLDVYWIVVPSLRSGGVLPSPMEVLMFVGMGVLWLAVTAMGVRASSRVEVGERSTAHA